MVEPNAGITGHPIYTNGFTSYFKDSTILEKIGNTYPVTNLTYNSTDYAKFPCTFLKDVSDVHKCNTTVYSYYSPELLWFGATCCVVFAIVGTVGNLISILALLRSKRLRNATTAFIVNLCVSDFLFSCFSMPLTALTYIDKKWNGSDELCEIFALIKFSNGIVSIFSVVAITMNRYVLIVHPRIYPTFFSKKNTAFMIFLLWFLSFALFFLPYLKLWGSLGYDPEVGDCGVMYYNGNSPRIMIFVVAAVLPSVLFIACYVKIYFVVSKSVRKVSRVEQRPVLPCTNNSDVRESGWLRKNSCVSKLDLHVHFRDKKESRLLRIVLVLFLFFVFSTFPLAYVKIFHKEYDLPAMNVFAYAAYFSAYVINPVIYIIMSEDYRRAYKELFCFRNLQTSQE